MVNDGYPYFEKPFVFGKGIVYKFVLSLEKATIYSSSDNAEPMSRTTTHQVVVIEITICFLGRFIHSWISHYILGVMVNSLPSVYHELAINLPSCQ